MARIQDEPVEKDGRELIPVAMDSALSKKVRARRSPPRPGARAPARLPFRGTCEVARRVQLSHAARPVLDRALFRLCFRARPPPHALPR